jgi:hypothetical protein
VAKQLLFQKPKKSAKRLKTLFYGRAGVGKTTAAIQFPRPAVIDTERGAENDQYVESINAREGVVLQTTNFQTILSQVRALATTEHPYQTLIIDPITVVFDAMAVEAKKRVGTDWSAHVREANDLWKHLVTFLSAIDMNVVYTAHSKNEWLNGEATGQQTFDGPKASDYWVDLIVEVSARPEGRVGIVRKSRITGLPLHDEFAWSYDELANRYGRAALERDCVPVDDDRLALVELIADHPEGEERLAVILKRGGTEKDAKGEPKGVATISELTNDQVGKAIEWLTVMK